MPTKPTRVERLVLALDELLALADAHERAELGRYRRLAFRFLTYNTVISRLMASLGIECEKRLDELHRAGPQPINPSDAATPSRYHAPGTTQTTVGFIGNHRMAVDTLAQAMADAAYSLRFYEHLQEASAVPSLHATLSRIIRQKRSELAVLQEHLASSDEIRCRVAFG